MHPDSISTTVGDFQADLLPIHRDHNILSMLGGIIGFFLLLGAMLYLTAVDHVVDMIFNLPALAWMVLAPPALLMPVYGCAAIVHAFAYLWLPREPGSAASAAASVFRLWAAFALVSGFVATLVSVVVMLARLEDPSNIGAGMAIVLLGQLYGVFIAMICLSIATMIERRHNGAEGAMKLARQAGGVAGITVVAGTLTVLVAFGILMLAFPGRV
ncbi:MAG TPA: MotA/TolQ/ExbB proton channel family protein [Phycisphaerae bacterium]|nr:MotA/TolQ/ExbB proton channel family protein [Phycisphaerae bacterium]